ncbi:hypothetical protein PG987_011018 [Apiospora arundinis]
MATPSQPLFGILPTGHPLVTEPSSAPTPTSFLYVLPSTTPTNPKPFSHLSVFLLPGITLPENTAAAIYLATNPEVLASGGQPTFRFLGGVGPGKESAVYKVSATGGQEGIVVGVSLEDAASIASRIEGLSASKADGTNSNSGALVKAGAVQPPTTQVLAQRIIKNAFNFLASFSGQAGQVEVVPLRAFEDWWRKFESRVRSDPTFLEREQE